MGYVEDQMKQWEANARAADRAMLPTDPKLMALAEQRAGHISLKAVAEEYDRLVEAKLNQPRGLFARLFRK
ncbi:hypothetical protein JJB98_24775 [Bradyrhizobium diazoefficiens]|nr:hypothetical protein [Bradyrhizobium diazoefficiens]QQO22906.1 hypothetical protein JJB98_24775 [Bradyrhizobium diazoefficiens]